MSLTKVSYSMIQNAPINPVDYGAVGDGSTNDTDAINAAVTAAAALKCGIDGNGLTYAVKNIRLLNGLAYFTGFNLIATVSGQQAVLELAGYNYSDPPVGVQTLAYNMIISNNDINCNNIAPIGIFGRDNYRITITENRIYNVPNTSSSNCGIQFSGGAYADARAPVNITIANNIINLPAIASVSGYTVNGIQILGANQSTNPSSDYQSLGYIPLPSAWADNFTISNNNITDGYYGIAAQGAQNCQIFENVFNSQMRAVQLINCLANLVHDNRMLNFNLSAVNCSFGSNNNNITNNFVRRGAVTLAVDNYEAALQSYVYSKSNVFDGNDVDTNGRYAIYLGVDVSYNIVRNNRVSGGTLSSIAVEADWINGMSPGVPAIARYSRASSSPQAQASTISVEIVGNLVFASPGDTGPIYVSCVSNNTAIFNNWCTVKDNVIDGVNSPNYYYYFVSVNSSNVTTNQISAMVFKDNVVRNGALTNSKVYIQQDGSGRLICSQCQNNTIVNDSTAYVANTNNATAVFVANADDWELTNTNPTTVTAINGGMIGQTVNLLIGTNTTLQNNATISLKGGVDATPPAGPNPTKPCIVLRLFDRWVEQSRNF
jgi:parallel beta-helix repeat protein